MPEFIDAEVGIKSDYLISDSLEIVTFLSEIEIKHCLRNIFTVSKSKLDPFILYACMAEFTRVPTSRIIVSSCLLSQIIV